MISGFNTDIEFSGVTYHVQTEDKGLDTPLILSLVYSGGEILAAKRTPYDDLIKSGFDENILSERLQRQHRLICAAIKQGRVEDLKRMNARDVPAKAKTPKAIESTELDEPIKVVEPTKTIEPKPIFEVMPADEIAVELLEIEPLAEIPVTIIEPPEFADQFGLFDPNKSNLRFASRETEIRRADAVSTAPRILNGLNLNLLDAHDFRGGDRVVLRIYVSHNVGAARSNVSDAMIMVKVLGAAFRPMILHAQTGDQGVATVHLQLPSFRTGRAAILIRATHNGHEAELRRIVTQG